MRLRERWRCIGRCVGPGAGLPAGERRKAWRRRTPYRLPPLDARARHSSKSSRERMLLMSKLNTQVCVSFDNASIALSIFSYTQQQQSQSITPILIHYFVSINLLLSAFKVLSEIIKFMYIYNMFLQSIPNNSNHNRLLQY